MNIEPTGLVLWVKLIQTPLVYQNYQILLPNLKKF